MLRWTLAPLSLLVLVPVNIMIVREGLIFQAAFAGQFLFYMISLIGFICRNREIRMKGFFVPYYFTVMNYCVYLGFWRYLKGSQSVIWERSERRIS